MARGKPVIFKEHPQVAGDPGPGQEPYLGKIPEDRVLTNDLIAEDYLRIALKLSGWDPQIEEGTKRTPERFLKYLKEFLNFEKSDETIMGPMFEGPKADGIGGMVVESRIPFRMICEHHLLPAVGHAWVGYIPRGHVIGLSKMARLVDAIATSRPSMQEVICEAIAERLYTYTQALGAITVIRASHSCMSCRGVNSPEVFTSTSTVRGAFRDVPHARQEFFNIAGIGSGG